MEVAEKGYSSMTTCKITKAQWQYPRTDLTDPHKEPPESVTLLPRGHRSSIFKRQSEQGHQWRSLWWDLIFSFRSNWFLYPVFQLLKKREEGMKMGKKWWLQPWSLVVERRSPVSYHWSNVNLPKLAVTMKSEEGGEGRTDASHSRRWTPAGGVRESSDRGLSTWERWASKNEDADVSLRMRERCDQSHNP